MITKKRILRISAYVAAAVLAVIVTTAMGWHRKLMRSFKSQDEGPEQARLYKVTRGNFNVSMVEEGQLRAVKFHAISYEADTRGMGKILWVIPQGTKVKKGDRIIEFEKKGLQDQMDAKKVELQNAEKKKVVDEENVNIEKSNGKSMISTAEAALSTANDAMKKYVELDAPTQKKNITNSYNEAQKAVVKAQSDLMDAQKKLAEESDPKKRAPLELQVTASKQTIKNANTSLALAAKNIKIYRTYDYPQGLAAKKKAVDNANLELKKATANAKSKEVQAQSMLDQTTNQIKRLNDELNDMTKRLDKCTGSAPVDGVVMYGDPSGGRMMMAGGEIKAGADCYPRQTLLTIPDFSKFVIDIYIPEGYRGKISVNCRSILTFDAIPGLQLDGRLREISHIAQPKDRYDPSSPKMYTGTIELANSDSRMVSGMTAKVEIITETVNNVLFVPRESVFNEEGQKTCFVPAEEGYERRIIMTGRSNDHFVEITEGISEGQQVCLYRPSNIIGGPMPKPRPTTQSSQSQPAASQPAMPPDNRTIPPASAPANRTFRITRTPPASAPASYPFNLPATQPASSPASRPELTPPAHTAPASGPFNMPVSPWFYLPEDNPPRTDDTELPDISPLPGHFS